MKKNKEDKRDIYDILEHEETTWESIKWFPYRVMSKTKNVYYNIKYDVQRLFRGYGDVDVYSFFSEISHVVLPRLIAYNKNKHGYPIDFMEYEESCGWETEEQYNKEKEEGKIIGGGPEAWDEVVDKMIFSFTQVLVHESYPRNRFEKKLKKDFLEKYGDIWEKKSENAHEHKYHLFYNKESGSTLHVPKENFDENEIENRKAEGYEYQGFKIRKLHYHNDALDLELNKKCQEGLELFSKYFKSLWD